MSDSTTFAVFNDRTEAAKAVEALVKAGVDAEQISLLMNEQPHGEKFAIKASSKAAEGGATGALAGGMVGAAAAGALAMGAVAIPVLGVFAAGPIVAALAGAGAGAATGGLAGALIGLGIPRDEAVIVRDQLHGGRVLVSVAAKAKEQQQLAKSIWSHTESAERPQAHPS